MHIARPGTAAARSSRNPHGNKLPHHGKRPKQRGRNLPQLHRRRGCHADTRAQTSWHRLCCNPAHAGSQTASGTNEKIDTRTRNLSHCI